MSPPAAKDSPSPKIRKIGSYRLLGELGRGGMATVYRAVHETLQREVAIKELSAESMRDREAQSRFRREALALANFRHQNIVTLYDLVEKNDALYMIMEYVDGPTLQQLLKEGPLPPEVVAIIGARVASALDQAHFSRIIHRDIKPANVMLTKSGEVKLMDFGIAKDEGMEALTKEGIAIGTPSYMSPEQVTGAPLDGRTDMFSLGVVMYECLTGARPFVGATAGEVFARIRDGKFRPISKAAPQVSPALDAVVRRCMKVKIEQRFVDAAELRRDLEMHLARQVSISHQALVVAFLRHRNKITETEALARLTSHEMEFVKTFSHLGRRSRWPWLVVTGGAAAAALYFTQHYWMPFVQQLMRMGGQ